MDQVNEQWKRTDEIAKRLRMLHDACNRIGETLGRNLEYSTDRGHISSLVAMQLRWLVEIRELVRAAAEDQAEREQQAAASALAVG